MLALVLFAQVVLSDSVYASPALRALVDNAAVANRFVPAALVGYHARVQTEMAVVLRGADELEGAIQVEQVALDVSWRRSGLFEQHAIGYRAGATTYTGASVFQLDTWSIPVLYGNHFDLFFGPDSARQRKRGKEGPIDEPPSIHPFAEGRNAVYRFRGGDTVATIHYGGRSIPIVRILVEPRGPPARTTTLFRGEIDLDGVSMQIARMRGEILEVGPRGVAQRIGETLARYAGYVELVNREVAGKYWLPSYQRVDFQVSSPPLGRAGLILRIQSRFTNFALDTSTAVASLQAGDTLIPFGRDVAIATADSLRRFKDWQFAMGDPTAGVRAEDFWTDTIATSVFIAGAPRGRVTLRPARAGDAFHYNRIEGAFTGYGIGVPLPSSGTLQVDGGWAWSERVVRGSATAAWQRGGLRYALMVGRALDMTNDFRRPFEGGATIPSLLRGRDEFDYVDRKRLAAGISRTGRLGAPLRFRIEAGAGRDEAVVPHVTRGLLRTDPATAARANRGVREGNYVRTTARIEYHPELQGRFIASGLAAVAAYERGDGQLAWQRFEARIRRRAIRGAFVVDATVEGGALFGSSPPPQQLFELGGKPRLPGYDYKIFGGDRAALLELRFLYRLPVLQTPIAFKAQRLPGVAPALALESHSGWADAKTSGTRRALADLGTVADPATGALRPISSPTDGVPTSVAIGLRLFGEMMFVGAVKTVETGQPWRATFELSSIFR